MMRRITRRIRGGEVRCVELLWVMILGLDGKMRRFWFRLLVVGRREMAGEIPVRCRFCTRKPLGTGGVGIMR